jgi:enamine deaminase RidA (YjgF/YER057c/UK114 family)
MDLHTPLIWRKFSGPLADEIYVQCRPRQRSAAGIAHQTAEIYQELNSLLQRESGCMAQVVYEAGFFRNIRRDFAEFQASRSACLQAIGGAGLYCPASPFIEQPPLDEHVDLLLSALAIIPRSEIAVDSSRPASDNCRALSIGGQKRLFAGGIHGAPGNAFDLTVSMFRRAGEILEKEGMSFHDVMRTWIHLRHIESDYAEFNRGRREFFQQQKIALLPASTGIYGSPFPEHADFELSFHALGRPERLETSAMTTPTLNEACTYGSDFSRGLRIVENNKVALYVSGTASVDEKGCTVHVNDFKGQVERMLLNVETLLAAQRASFQHVLSAVTYVKSPEDAAVLRRMLRERDLENLPNALVHAAVCRPDLLCEIEIMAALHLPA